MALSLSRDRGFQAFWRGFLVDLCPGLGDLRAKGQNFLQYHVPKKPHDGITRVKFRCYRTLHITVFLHISLK